MANRIYTGTIPTPTIKKGDSGEKVKNLQRFLNWYGNYKLVVDGKCGRKTISALKKFQKKEKLTADGVYGPKSQAKAKSFLAAPVSKPVTPKPKPITPAPAPVVVSKKIYSGRFPAPNNNAKIVNGLAYRMCYPYGTPKSKYTFAKGSPKKEYKEGIDKVFPNHKDWPNKRQRVGACCDILTAVELGLVGIKVKKDLKNQVIDTQKMTKELKSNGHYKAEDFKLGDIVYRVRKDMSGHTYTICELVNGQRYIANAHYKHFKGCYAVMDSKVKTEKPSKWKYYKCYTVQGAIRTDYRENDYGYDVLYIQKFLNWYGFTVTPDGDFGPKTKNAVKAFQEKEKLLVDGKVGEKTIAKMKTIKK